MVTREDNADMLTLIENGEIYTPRLIGRRDVLLVHDKIAKIGKVNRAALEKTDLDLAVIDATDCLVTPGFIDPHQHLLGGSGEEGFASQTPEIFLSEIISGGITTVVGCLGVDTTTKTMPGLLARAKALNEEGLTAFIYSGGYNVPPTTLTGSLRDDLIFVDEVIGVGEVAISDVRANEPSLPELARVVSEAYVGGLLSKKAGITHIHVGDRKERLAPLRALIGQYSIEPQWLYPTHVERNKALIEEAAAFTKYGAFVDVDTVEEDLPIWLRCYLHCDGDPRQLTVSSDAGISSPVTLYKQICSCVLDQRFPMDLVLPLVTSNTAAALKLENKGRLEPGKDADLLVLRRDSMELREVIARGRRLIQGGELRVHEKFLARSNRSINLYGHKP